MKPTHHTTSPFRKRRGSLNTYDEVVVIRPGTDGALALGAVQVILKENLYDEKFVRRFTDLPLLVRTDTLEHLSPEDLDADYQAGDLKHSQVVDEPGDAPPVTEQDRQVILEKMRVEWGDYMMWDKNSGGPVAVTRDEVGVHFDEKKYEPALEGRFKVTLSGGEEVEVEPVFSMIRRYIDDSFTPKQVSELTWAPEEAIYSLARQIAENSGSTLIAVGMGPNHFFNNDCKDRHLMLLCALTGNIGRHGGNIGSYAGNYRAAYLNGLGHYNAEDVFDLELNPDRQSRVKAYYRAESAHYYNYGDRPLRVGNKNFTGTSHTPTPTKSMWFSNGNSILGNAKWHHDVVENTLPKIECIIANDWWWTGSCEYSDIVFGVDSWAELPYPDLTASVTNPFLQVFPERQIPRLHDTRGDIETFGLVAQHLARITGDQRFTDCWKFILEDEDVRPYLQRILDAGTATKGYDIDKLIEDAEQGTPALLMTRTYPKLMGWEQTNESKPSYTKSGRLEFYRPEPEFLEYGENLPVYREPVDGTHHEPNVIVGKEHNAFRYKEPADYDLDADDQSVEVRQVRNVLKTPAEVMASHHSLHDQGYDHVYITPKYRHGAHTTPVDTDIIAAWFGPFGDMHRHDKRMPWVNEGYVDMHPQDARELGLHDGDYVYVDGDPADRPYRGFEEGSRSHKIHRCMLRVRFYNGIPRGVTRSWFNMYGSTRGSVEGHETRADGLARNPRTGYQAMYRYGSHQSCTRAWLRPTCLTDSLVRKDTMGQVIGQGFEPDVHCAVGAPKESFVKYTRAESGSQEKDLWRPAALGLRPSYESKAMKAYLNGEYGG